MGETVDGQARLVCASCVTNSQEAKALQHLSFLCIIKPTLNYSQKR